MADEKLSERLGRSIRDLRVARGQTQSQMAKLAGIPRATWANLESSTANPTLSVLHRVARALQIPIEELVSQPRSEAKHYRKASLPCRRRGDIVVQTLLPDNVPGMVIERIEIPSNARLAGVPHTPGTREYLTCETGDIELVASGRTWKLAAGDVVVFRGDQRHSYFNPGRRIAVGYSVVVLRPVD